MNNQDFSSLFHSHIGLLWYKRLNFGINVAGENFQHAIRHEFINTPGVSNVVDHLLVFGDTLPSSKISIEYFDEIERPGLTL